MANRVVNGNTHTENGWPLVDEGSCNWIRVLGTNEHVSLQIQKGQPTTIMGAFAADYHAYIEPLRDADSACWTRSNSVLGQPGRNNGSNHLGGTGMDLNWQGADGKTFRLGISKERAYPGDRARNLDELLKFYEGMIFCGGEWSIRDWMHFQMGGNTYNNPKTADFIRRKIRADGFSTFRRGEASTPLPVPKPHNKADEYALAIMAEGRRRGITARGIQIAFSVVFVESNWKMYANSTVPASLKLPHDAVGSDHDSVGLFQQRHPMWGPLEVLMDPTKSAGLFYDRLAKMNYNNPNVLPGNIAADIQRPAAKYRGRYQERMPEAVALYNRLAHQTSMEEDDFMSALSPEEQRAMYDELMRQRTSKSPLRRAGERNIGNAQDIAGNVDGSVHVLVVDLLARLGDPRTLALLGELASLDLSKHSGREGDRNLALAILENARRLSARRATPQAAPAAPTYPLPQTPMLAQQPLPFVPSTTPDLPAGNGLYGEVNNFRDLIREITNSLSTTVKGE